MWRRRVSGLPRVSCLVGVVVGALACDPGEPARPVNEPVVAAPARDFASGSRLRARYHVVDGLVDVFTTFHDAVLDVDCAYEDENGAHVGPGASSFCLPGGMARHREGKGPYLDRACSARAAFAAVNAAGTAATLALVEPRDACATAPEVYVAQAPRRRRAFLRDDDGSCVEAASDSVQSLGDTVPLSTFARAVEQVEPRDGRIAARVLVGDDGSRRVVGGHDRQRNEASRVGTLPDGARRWVPARTAFVGGGEPLFTDATCAVPAAAKIARTATCPLSAALVLDGSCGAGRYFELGAPLATVFASDVTSACVTRPAGEQLAFGLGASIPASAYAGVSAVDVGTLRVRRRGVGGEGDRPAAWAELVDVSTGEPCEVAPTVDGSLRCLPSASAAVSFFADAACSEPAFAHAVTGCELAAPPRVVRDAFDLPARVFEVVRELSAVFTADAGRCVPYGTVVPSRLFAVRELDPSSFPPATLASE